MANMTESKAIKIAVIHAAIQRATAAVMVLREADTVRCQ